MPIRIAIALALSPLLASSALAHHPMGGRLPSTWIEGLLSGLGHPIIGIDHAAFIIGIGLLAAVAGFGPLLPVAFVVAMAGGVALHLAAFNLPGVELAVAASVILIGLAITRTTRAAAPVRRVHWLEGGAFALAGLFHGYALAESIVGAEPTPLAAYLAGLVICQSAIALAAFVAVGGVAGLTAPQAKMKLAPAKIRAAGLAIVAVGAAFAVQAAGLIA